MLVLQLPLVVVVVGVVIVVGASVRGMLGDAQLEVEGVENAKLDTVPVDDPGDESSGGDEEDVVGIHGDNVVNNPQGTSGWS